jgi:hypothetical protein
VLRFCLDVILQVRSLSPYRHDPFLRSANLGQDAVPDLSSVSASVKCILFSLPLKTL